MTIEDLDRLETLLERAKEALEEAVTLKPLDSLYRAYDVVSIRLVATSADRDAQLRSAPFDWAA